MFKFAQKFMEGEYKDCSVFIGIIEAFMESHAWHESGKTMYGMHYSPELDALSHSLHAQSPYAYWLLWSVLPLCSPQSLQYALY